MEPYRLLLYNFHLFTPVDDWQPGWLLTENRHIIRLGPGAPRLSHQGMPTG